MKALFAASIALLLSACTSVPVSDTQPTLVSTGVVPDQWLVCVIVDADPACTQEAGGPDLVQESSSLLSLARKVDLQVNDEFRPIACTWDATKKTPKNLRFSWKRPGRGPLECVTCIGYALEKRARLMEHGVPGNALRFAVVQPRTTPQGTWHLLLLLYTDRNPNDPYVLNALGPDPRNPLHKLGTELRKASDLVSLQGLAGTWYVPTTSPPSG